MLRGHEVFLENIFNGSAHVYYVLNEPWALDDSLFRNLAFLLQFLCRFPAPLSSTEAQGTQHLGSYGGGEARTKLHTLDIRGAFQDDSAYVPGYLTTH